jgi:integrase
LPNNFYDKIISLKTVPKKKKILPIDNFQKILETRIENDQLEDSRQIFLFQVFSNGLRFSDVSTLRYKDFVIETFKGIPEIRFLKYQRKTRKLINTLVNFRTCKILARFIPRDSISMNDSQKLDYILQSDLVQNRVTSKLLETDSIKETLTVKLDNEIIGRHFFTNPITVSVQELVPLGENHTKLLREKFQKEGLDDVSIEVLISQNEDLNYFNNLIEVVRKKVQLQLENNLKNEKNLNLEFYKIIAKILSDCKLKRPLDFVFPLLNNEDFSNIIADDGFSLVSYKQQILLNKSTISFNKNLKEICHILEIPTITSHFARNSFGSLLIALRGEKAIDPFSLMYAMGHSSIQQTQEYIQSLTHEGKDDLTKSLADNF